MFSSQNIQAITVLLAVFGFLFGVFQFFKNETIKREEQQIEAKRPFLELQLTLYQEAAGAASTIANSEAGSAERIDAEKKFYHLFWGRLAMVEDSKVEEQMVKFRDALKEDRGQTDLQQSSYALAVAIRNSLSVSWKVGEWKSHHSK